MDRREPTVCWYCFRAECEGFCDEHEAAAKTWGSDNLRRALGWIALILCAAAFGALVALGASCTAEQGALAKQETTAIGAKVEQCLTQALADEIGSIVMAHTIMATQPIAPVAQPQTILVPVLPSMPHEPVDTNARDAGAM